MKPQSPRFALLLISTALPWVMAPASGQDASTPPASSSSAVIKLPPFDVTASKEPPPSALKQAYEKLNHVFEGPFPSLRSGPLIEAILWRHHYLAEHPNETAVIVTTQTGGKIRSATTVYTKGGKVYGSSNALGETLLVKGLLAADLATPNGLAKAKKYIAGVREDDIREAKDYLNASRVAGIYDNTPVPAQVPNFRSLFVAAEESGDYGILVAAAGQAQQFVPSDAAVQNGDFNPQIQGQWQNGNDELGKAFFQAFAEPSHEVLSWTYQALHDSARAGIVPVAFTRVRVQGTVMTISPFEMDISPSPALQPHDIISEKKGVTQMVEAIVFDWEGVQYLYQPDIGTEAKPLPINSVTGLPYLCLKGGGLMECAYFCATYVRQHPDEKAVLLPGDPVLAAYQKEGKLGLFIPALGNFTLPKDYWSAIDDNDALGQIRDQLVVLQKQKNAAPDVIPAQVTGDDADMQMRRAFLAFQAEGIPSLLKEETGPSLDFTWNGVAYVYGADQQVRPAPAE